MLLRLPAVRERTGLSTSEIYRRIAKGQFPQQLKVGPKTAAWVAHEIDAWTTDRIRERGLA
jgi:prophage regulatory protein